MTVRLVTTIHIYSGLSTDVKPMSGVRSGSVFHELDTGSTYRFGDGSGWAVDKSVPLSAGEYQIRTAELRRLMEQTLLQTQAANLANGIEVR